MNSAANQCTFYSFSPQSNTNLSSSHKALLPLRCKGWICTVWRKMFCLDLAVVSKSATWFANKSKIIMVTHWQKSFRGYCWLDYLFSSTYLHLQRGSSANKRFGRRPYYCKDESPCVLSTRMWLLTKSLHCFSHLLGIVQHNSYPSSWHESVPMENIFDDRLSHEHA